METIVQILEHKLKNPPYIREKYPYLSISWIIKEDVYKKTANEIFTKTYRYDYTYNLMTNEINHQYFMIDNTTWIGECKGRF
jgi:hypothetical protein